MHTALRERIIAKNAFLVHPILISGKSVSQCASYMLIFNQWFKKNNEEQHEKFALYVSKFYKTIKLAANLIFKCSLSVMYLGTCTGCQCFFSVCILISVHLHCKALNELIKASLKSIQLMQKIWNVWSPKHAPQLSIIVVGTLFDHSLSLPFVSNTLGYIPSKE